MSRIILIILFLSSCTTNNHTRDVSKIGLVFFSFKLHKNKMELKPIKGLKVSENRSRVSKIRTPFVISSPNKSDFKAVQICASEYDSIFTQISVGVSIDNVPCFVQGTGMAASGNKLGGWNLFLAKGNAHNYFPKARTINTKNFRTIMVRSVLHRRGNKYKKKKFYMIVMIDKNSNRVVDQGEYELFHMSF